MTHFALLSHPGSDNIGDDIQSLAARAFLPRVDRLVSREGLDIATDIPPMTRVVLNGWFMHDPRRWPPAEALDPLLISFHVTGRGRSRLQRWAPTVPGRLVVGKRADYLRRHGPVGARDNHTLELLRRHDIDAYLSGCLTLTLDAPAGAPNHGAVVACDLPEASLAVLAARTHKPPVAVTHSVDRPMTVEDRFAEAERLLALYAGARSVVTTRLHCALPCLAMGIPVLFLDIGQDPRRVEGALDLVHRVTPDELATADFDPENPPANPARHLAMADALRQRVCAFVDA